MISKMSSKFFSLFETRFQVAEVVLSHTLFDVDSVLISPLSDSKRGEYTFLMWSMCEH